MNEKTGIIKKSGCVLYTLLIFLFVADPTNTILGLKSVVFALLLFYNIIFLKPNWYNLIYSLIPILVVLLSWVFAVIQGNNVNVTELKAVLQAFSPLLLLLWSNYYDVVKLSVLPVTLTAIIVLILFWVIFFLPELEGPIYMYMGAHNDTIMMSNRSILGVRIFCMYLKSTVALLPVYGFALYKILNKGENKILYILIALALLHLFLISGTRSSILLPILLLFIMIFVYCRNGRRMRYVVYPAVLFFVIIFIVFLAMMLMEKTEDSNLVKYGHLNSYKELFSENPIYLLIGQGPGTEFYSEGFRRMTMETEWTYLELLRNYGLLCLPILYVVMRPLVVLFNFARKNDVALAMLLSFVIYLVIAGTNPLLLSSTGILVLLSMYSFIDILKQKTD